MNPLPSNRIKTKTVSLPVEIAELQRCVMQIPEQARGDIEKSLNRVIEFTQRRRRILNLVQEALGQLRLDMKYLMFDLDATRRERDVYKKALDEEA